MSFQRHYYYYFVPRFSLDNYFVLWKTLFCPVSVLSRIPSVSHLLSNSGCINHCPYVHSVQTVFSTPLINESYIWSTTSCTNGCHYSITSVMSMSSVFNRLRPSIAFFLQVSHIVFVYQSSLSINRILPPSQSHSLRPSIVFDHQSHSSSKSVTLSSSILSLSLLSSPSSSSSSSSSVSSKSSS
jgi:hypothetical protein